MIIVLPLLGLSSPSSHTRKEIFNWAREIFDPLITIATLFPFNLSCDLMSAAIEAAPSSFHKVMSLLNKQQHCLFDFLVRD